MHTLIDIRLQQETDLDDEPMQPLLLPDYEEPDELEEDDDWDDEDEEWDDEEAEPLEDDDQPFDDDLGERLW